MEFIKYIHDYSKYSSSFEKLNGKPVLDFFDSKYTFDSLKQVDTEKYTNSSKKPTEYVFSVASKLNNQNKEYPILFKTEDDLRNDFFILQALQLIEKVK